MDREIVKKELEKIYRIIEKLKKLDYFKEEERMNDLNVIQRARGRLMGEILAYEIDQLID